MWNSLLNSVPLPVILAFITSSVIPYLSALVTRHPGWWTGAITIVLSTASGFFSEWAAAGSKFDWRAAVLVAIGNFFVAAASHSKTLKGTPLEAKLYVFPRPINAAPPQQQAA